MSGDIDSIIDSVWQAPDPKRADEFTAAEAAERWGISMRAAHVTLDGLLVKGRVTRRWGRSESGRPVYFFSAKNDDA